MRATVEGRAPRRPPVPKALQDVAAAHAARHPEDPDDKGYTGITFLERGSAAAAAAHVGDLKDAGNALVVADNAHLYTLGFSYHASRAKEAWVVGAPVDKKLTIRVALTPSWHVSATPVPKPPADTAGAAEWDAYDTAWNAYERSCRDNATRFALTNRYNVEVTGPDGKTSRTSFGVNGQEPEFASVSPPITLDLTIKGSFTIKGWADGSAGPSGYTSARVTIIHNE
ncbi:MAG TPA: hypothetical protein VGF99_12950 [Myxococcota bacterium]